MKSGSTTSTGKVKWYPKQQIQGQRIEDSSALDRYVPTGEIMLSYFDDTR